ncbi:alpha/beta fold hydrolase [Novosphingobium sp. Leaf2]|uniref:alpha/beta fold hydrolase n=1 Tax=Novosphingobium sp. Leaf2 TaxID=1735670 RepID=UPI0006F27BF0|nr:alpha/beta hydrolase [Novosphingobium sp. Leaf2]KQM18460.1 hydrolase [Novosphingobium sp. Leaf2]
MNEAERKTLYLVPGLLCDDVVWAHQTAALARYCDVRIPDLTACARISDMAAGILAGAPPRFAVAGHSMGARVALEMFAQAPERIERIALLDTGVHPPAPNEATTRAAMLDISASRGMRALADHWLPPMVAEGAFDRDPALRATLYAMVERMSPAIHRNQINALLHRPDARPLLQTITCPTLVGVGEHDRWSPPEQHHAIAAAIAHARYVLFPDCGHMAPMENPEAVTDALVAWMHAKA